MRKPAPESQPDKGAAKHTCGRQVRRSICSFCPAVAGAGYIPVPAVSSAAGCIKHFTGPFLAEHGCCEVWGLRAQWGSSPVSSVCSAAICEGLRAVWGETMKFPCPNKKGRAEKPEFGKSMGIRVAGRDKHSLLCWRLFAAWEFSAPAATELLGAGLGPWTSGFRWPVANKGLHWWPRQRYCSVQEGGPGCATTYGALLLSPPGKHESHAVRGPITESRRDEKLIKELVKSNKYWKSYFLHCPCSRFH